MDADLISTVIQGRAQPLGNYPHLKCIGDLIYLSGTTARMPDGSIGGVLKTDDGRVIPDAAQQTRIVIENVRNTLATVGAELSDCIDIQVFLTNMDDFATYNEVYGKYFDVSGPVRTTVGVQALPHADMVVEMKVVAHKKER